MDPRSSMTGRLCALIAIIFPAFMVVIMSGFKRAFEVLPPIAACSISFAGVLLWATNTLGPELAVIFASIAALISMVLVMKFWQPAQVFRLEGDTEATAKGHSHSMGQILFAWSPYMLLVADVKPDKRLPLAESDRTTRGLDKLKIHRSRVPAITHVDNSARVQTVDRRRHVRYYRLLKAFEEQTGSPVLINTSFNVRGEPIVCTPEEAWRCFMATNMDVLVIEDFVMHKDRQPGATEHEIDEYLARFELD